MSHALLSRPSTALLVLVLGCGWAWAAQAQFEAAPKPAAATADGGFALPVQQAQRLSYQYAYGMESPFTYRRNMDLDQGVRDDLLLFKAKIFGSIVYRPTDWLAMTLEMKLGREYPLHEEPWVPLPNGDIRRPPRRQPTLLVEQALLTVRQIIAPFELNIGRRNYEDDRHWVFDGSMDVVSLSFRHEDWRAEAMMARDVLWRLDLLRHVEPQRIESTLLSLDYRGFDDQVLTAYLLRRNDLGGREGRPLTWGLRAHGKPTAAFSWWAEAALLRGSDESGRPFRARALDIGATYRFADLPMDPNMTLAYAYGSGDPRADDGINTEFRQSGLQTNEAKYIGLSKFKAYGEMLDSELSNLHILTLGLGARPAPGISVDLIYHRYRLDALATEIRNWGLSAQMNTGAGPPSKDVGQALDLVLGLRGLFGIRRLGLDLRAGLFFPGQAFQGRAANPGANPGADPGASIVAKFRY